MTSEPDTSDPGASEDPASDGQGISEELGRTAALLNAVFEPDSAFTVESLRWYYEDNPNGPAAVGRVETDGRRIGNYALVPHRFVDPECHEIVLGIGVDLAVDPEARGGGVFRRTVEDSYRRSVELGRDGILGVANANSAPRMVSALGWRALESLPVMLLAPVPGRTGFRSSRWRSLDEVAIDGILDRLDVVTAANGWSPVWSAEVLRWRMGRPGADYWLHRSETHLVISTRTAFKGVPVGVVLKVLPFDPQAGPVSGGRVATAVMRAHRTPFVLHWGRSPWLRRSGLRLPAAWMPSPLSLVLHSFRDQSDRDQSDRGPFDRDGFELAALEFLDFDAY